MTDAGGLLMSMLINNPPSSNNEWRNQRQDCRFRSVLAKGSQFVQVFTAAYSSNILLNIYG